MLVYFRRRDPQNVEDERTISFFNKAESYQRVESEAGVPNPAVTVIPVSDTLSRCVSMLNAKSLNEGAYSNVLGKTERRRRNDSARGFKDEKLQRQSRTKNRFLPRSRIRRLANPIVPVPVRRLYTVSIRSILCNQRVKLTWSKLEMSSFESQGSSAGLFPIFAPLSATFFPAAMPAVKLPSESLSIDTFKSTEMPG